MKGESDRAPDGVNQKLGWAVMVEQEEEESDRALDIGQPDLDKQTDKKCT
ncbi:MAG: hypothetical protein RID53_29570 [Coleofasciculus sp. B1-GNL1-01]